ncbi:MAG: glycosyltransferase [bacterium]|nr:glycosyltransferase [bacterium]
MISHSRKHIAIFVSYSGQGGVEHVMNLLSREFVAKGVRVDLVLSRAAGAHLGSIPRGVNIVDLRTRHTYSAIFRLAKYLRTTPPDALLAVKHRGILTAVLARFISEYKGMLAGNIHTNVSASLKHSSWLKRTGYISGMRLFYKWTDLVIGVSQGVADDIMKITGLPPQKVITIHNPVVTEELFSKAALPADHPWFKETGVPVILGMGRLTKQKDFHTLIQAFAMVRKGRQGRLMILGDGGDLESLKELAEKLGVAGDVEFPGFQKNPFPYLAGSSLFVLSSRWEGFGMVLVEALALGVPVVSTDCPSGPREILENGRYGFLVPVEDPMALSRAIGNTLDNPIPSDVLETAASRYTTERISEDYLLTLSEGPSRSGYSPGSAD